MLLATINEAVTLSMLLADGRTDLFGQVRIYDSGGTLQTTINLTHSAEGLYQAQYTPGVEGYFNVVYQVYFDVGRTMDAGYDKQGETLDVNSFRINLLKVLGLVYENSVIDQQSYDVDGNLLSGRVRSYDSATNANQASAVSPAPYTIGLRYTWNVTAAYNSGLLSKYTITLAP